MVLVPEIKLIRTDTTLDLSQKAEKVCLAFLTDRNLYRAQKDFRSGYRSGKSNGANFFDPDFLGSGS